MINIPNVFVGVSRNSLQMVVSTYVFINLARNRDKWWALVSTAMSLRVLKDARNYLTNYWLLKKKICSLELDGYFFQSIAMDFVCYGRSWSCNGLPVLRPMYSILKVSLSSLDTLCLSVTATVLNQEGQRHSHRKIVPSSYQHGVLEDTMNFYQEFCLP